MKHLLTRGCAICRPYVETRRPRRLFDERAQLFGGAKQLSGDIGRTRFEIRDMRIGNDEQVAGVDGEEIEKRGDGCGLEDEAAGGLAREDAAEDAGHYSPHTIPVTRSISSRVLYRWGEKRIMPSRIEHTTLARFRL